MNGKYILDDAGQPVPEPDVMKWAAWFESAKRHVADTTIRGAIVARWRWLRWLIPDTPVHVRVSTVFLGLDHSFGDGPPILFESMVFGGPLDGDQHRYPTRAAALAGHDQLVAQVRDALAAK